MSSRQLFILGILKMTFAQLYIFSRDQDNGNIEISRRHLPVFREI